MFENDLVELDAAGTLAAAEANEHKWDEPAESADAESSDAESCDADLSNPEPSEPQPSHPENFDADTGDAEASQGGHRSLQITPPPFDPARARPRAVVYTSQSRGPHRRQR